MLFFSFFFKSVGGLKLHFLFCVVLFRLLNRSIVFFCLGWRVFFLLLYILFKFSDGIKIGVYLCNGLTFTSATKKLEQEFHFGFSFDNLFFTIEHNTWQKKRSVFLVFEKKKFG